MFSRFRVLALVHRVVDSVLAKSECARRGSVKAVRAWCSLYDENCSLLWWLSRSRVKTVPHGRGGDADFDLM